jgi:methylmalonyl-CoA/ethylmalonyl-CoA epimerase
VSIQTVDHIALGVKDLDERIDFFVNTLGMRLIRVGTHFASGGRIAMLADTAGFKLELIENGSEQPTFIHLAYRVDDVEAGHDELVSNGCSSIREPHELSAAKATTALVEDPSRLQIQLIKYAPDSPDI